MATDLKGPFRRLAPSVDVAPIQTEENTFRFVFSNEKVGRDRFIVLNRGIRHANYDRNPIILFAHADKQPPIGRGSNIDTRGTDCIIDITFVDRSILPFAGTIRDLVAGKWMRACSFSWQPIKYQLSSEPGVDAIFTEVDMLEVSPTPLPALPDALLAARSHGVDTRPLYEWASESLDMDHLGSIDRPQLEAICRAARPTSVHIGANMRTAEERRARARELQRGTRATPSGDEQLYQKWEVARDVYGMTVDQFASSLRMERSVLQARLARVLTVPRSASPLASGSRGLSETDRGKLRAMGKDLGRANRAHGGLSNDHDTLGENIEAAQVARRRLTSTLKEFGEKDRAARTTGTLAALGYDHHKVTRDVETIGECLDVIAGTHRSAVNSAGDAHSAVRRARSGLEEILGS